MKTESTHRKQQPWQALLFFCIFMLGIALAAGYFFSSRVPTDDTVEAIFIDTRYDGGNQGQLSRYATIQFENGTTTEIRLPDIVPFVLNRKAVFTVYTSRIGNSQTYVFKGYVPNQEAP